MPITDFWQLLKFLHYLCCALKFPAGQEAPFTERFCILKPPPCVMPTKKILPSNKCRRLNTGSALTSRQEASPASAEVDPSTSSTPSVSLRGDTESAEVSRSLSGQTVMDTHRSVVPSQPTLVEPRSNKRRDRSPSETSDGRADTSRGNPSSDRGNPSSDRGNPSSDRGNPSVSNRGNTSDQESPVLLQLRLTIQCL